ncbi:MAG TPA: hypothetical protein VEK31_04790 [Xanthobacteraceae bacterium]|nr:hypothetical protein [Xanthobacteraceae bacterium]
MLKLCYLLFGVAILLALVGDSWGHSRSKPEPENKSGALSSQQGANQKNPSNNFSTQEQLEKTISDGINAAAQKYEARHPPMPPDNSTWWFNFWLVAFTGGLVVVGAGQCFLTFWTLKATSAAASAALRQANILAAVEGPIPLIAGMKLVQYQQVPGEITITDPVPPGPIPANCRILMLIENKGRTALRLTEVCIEKFAGVTLPAHPTYNHTEPWGLVLEKGPVWIRFPDTQAFINPAEVGAAAAADPNGAFWVFGFFAYLSPLNERVEHKFLSRWDLAQGFMPDHRPGYT